MRGEGRKRKSPPTSQDALAVQRSRDDIQEFNFGSVLPEKEKTLRLLRKRVYIATSATTNSHP